MTPQRSLLDKILAALGWDPTRLRWRFHRLRERSRRLVRQAENRSRAVSYQHKICSGCGLTVAAEERRCPRCGQTLRSVAVQRLVRMLRVVVPEGTYTYTTVMMLVCVAFYLAMLMRSGGTAALMSGIATPVVVRFGAWTVPAIAAGQVWRLVTPIFLHFDLLHLIFNGLWLAQLGPVVEESYGRSRYLLIILATGTLGFAASVLYRWGELQGVPVPGGGASGVVFGLIGVALAATLRQRSRKLPTDELRGSLVKGVLYGLIFSLLPGVDLMAHLGGGVTGVGLGLILADRQRTRRAPARIWLGVEASCLLTVLGSFALVALRP